MPIISCIERTPQENHMFAAVDGGTICNRCQLFVLTNSSVVQKNILIEIKHELKVISKRIRKIEHRLISRCSDKSAALATIREESTDEEDDERITMATINTEMMK
jgi:hypothetical protein